MAEAILRHRAAFIAKHRPTAQVRSLLGLLPLCRTAALGGHLYRCQNCGRQQPQYNSCGNRHCPNCQAKAREAWLAEQEAGLLELPYFHVVFTLPKQLQPLILQNKQTGYNLLFGCVAETLMQFGRHPNRNLNGQLGFTAVLHTWNQTLGPHAHLHLLVPAGALNKLSGSFRKAPDPRWFFPVKALSKVFRAIFLNALKRAHTEGRLEFHGQLAELSNPEAFVRFLDPLYDKKWVVYAKRPFAGPQQVLQYLGRYTHRVGISNARIIEVTDQHVTFTYRDRKDASQKKIMKLEGVEFLRRFFLHVLPKGFSRIRHYGFLGNSVKRKNLIRIREQIGQKAPEPQEETPLERIERVYGIDLLACPHCRSGRLVLQRQLPAIRCKDPPP